MGCSYSFFSSCRNNLVCTADKESELCPWGDVFFFVINSIHYFNKQDFQVNPRTEGYPSSQSHIPVLVLFLHPHNNFGPGSSTDQ